MASLRQLLAQHGSLLVLDAASSRIQVGWLTADTARWEASNEEAGIGVFRGLEALGQSPETAGAVAFCDGPGSILGIRTVAMALRAWTVLKPRPTFAYCSLAMVAHADPQRDVSVIADARRNTWHCYTIDRGLRRVGGDDLRGPLVMPEHFRHWSPLPAGVQPAPYSLAELMPRGEDHDLFAPTSAPDAFLHEEPSYVTWTPQIHRAPSASMP